MSGYFDSRRKAEAMRRAQGRPDAAAPDAALSVVLIPARNEQSTVGAVVREVRDELGWDVVVVDDASTDRTAAEARAAGATVLPLALHLGSWGAIQAGIRYTLRHGYQWAITMDADGQHLAAAIGQLLPPLLSGRADVVIGACTQRGSRARRFAWRFFRGLSGLGVEDLTSGFRAYNRAAIAALASRDATLLIYQDIGVLILLRAVGLRIGEVAVPMRPRLAGHSRIFGSWFAVGSYLLHTGILCMSKWDRPLPGGQRRKEQA